MKGATLCEAVGFSDGESVHRALVSTWVQGDAARLVLDVAVMKGDTRTLQGDICPIAAQSCSPCKDRKTFPHRFLEGRLNRRSVQHDLRRQGQTKSV